MRPFLLLLCAALPMMAQAQEEPAVDGVYPERSEVIFEGPLQVEGELVRPSGQVLNLRRRAAFTSLVQLRSNFNAEMAESLNEVR